METETQVEITEDEKDKLFANAYSQLVKEHKREIMGFPQWKQSQDTGDWRLIITYLIRRIAEI